MWCTIGEGHLVLEIKVFPKNPHSRLGPVDGGRLQVRIHAAPEDGAANAAVVALLARAFAVSSRDVSILLGQTSRMKTIRITGSTVDPGIFEKGSVDVKSK